MSGLYFPNMKVPDNCLVCPVAQYDYEWGKVCPFSGVPCLNLGRQADCPIIFVQDHGDLIDADALIEEHSGIFDSCIFPSEVRAAPVIIKGDNKPDESIDMNRKKKDAKTKKPSWKNFWRT